MIKRLLGIPKCINCTYFKDSPISYSFAKCTHRTTERDEAYGFIKYPYIDLEREFMAGECGYFGKYFEDK